MVITSAQDPRRAQLVASVSRALTLANDAAVVQGTDPADSLVTIAEETSPTGRVWRVHYGPRDYVNRRGGDLVVLVDEQTDAVQRILHGQ